MAQFAVIKDKCFFCGQEKTVLFEEHYTFCPSCAAIYTSGVVAEDVCEHFADTVVVVDHLPWFKEYIEGKAFITEEGNHCSICGKKCIADGW